MAQFIPLTLIAVLAFTLDCPWVGGTATALAAVVFAVVLVKAGIVVGEK